MEDTLNDRRGGEPQPHIAIADRPGTRAYYCDAAATAQVGDHHAAALIDCIGNSLEVSETAQLLAEVAARVGARRGALAGLLAAAELIAAPDADRTDPDGVGVLAVTGQRGGTAVAWTGDCRAWGFDGTRLRQYTTDHTIGEQLRQNGASWEVSEAHNNWIAVTLSRLTIATCRLVFIPADEMVILTSDGVHDQMAPEKLEQIVRACADRPECLDTALVAAAEADEDGYRDDATAIVICPRTR